MRKINSFLFSLKLKKKIYTYFVKGFADLISTVESVEITVSKFSQTFTNRMQITDFPASWKK